jgi:hypothetical protein
MVIDREENKRDREMIEITEMEGKGECHCCAYL